MTLPPEFINRTTALLGNEYPAFESALLQNSPVSIRLNQNKIYHKPEAEPVNWCESGYYLPERIPFTFDPMFHAGVYYVQEASSMFLEQAIKSHVSSPVICLDLCAAPGGKSTHLIDILPKGSLLVSNEVIRPRSNILAENMTKWGNPFSIVTNNDPAEFGNLTNLFDVIVTDLPCSGEGMFRKDPGSIAEWSVANVELCAARQRRIIHDCWDALKPGGLLIYSTCTYNLEENEENIHHIVNELGAEAQLINTPKEWNITGAFKYDYPAYRFLPHKTKGEGFFLAVLRKKENEDTPVRSKAKKRGNKTTKQAVPEQVKQWISTSDQFNFSIKSDKIMAFPSDYMEIYEEIAHQLHMVSAGILLGELKGKDIIPSHSLTMSTVKNKNVFPEVEVDWKQVIRYLRKETLNLPEGIPKGHLIVTYKGMPLGFIKNIGNRSNNLYPQEWRIRSGYLPDNIVSLSLLR